MSLKMTVRSQLAWTFGIMVFLILLIAALSLYSLDESAGRFRLYVNRINVRGELAHEVRTAINHRAVAARNMVLATRDADREMERQAVLSANTHAHASLAKLQEMAQDAQTPPEARALVEEMLKIEQSYTPVALSIVDLASKGEREQAIAKINDECRPLLVALIGKTRQYQELVKGRAQKMLAESEEEFSSQLRNLIGLGTLATVFALLAGIFITRSVLRTLGAEPDALSHAARAVAEGDLSPVPGAAQAPAASVLAALAAMQQNLAHIVGQVRNTSDSITTGSTEIASGNTDLSQRTEEQASALQQTAATMEQFTVTVRNNAENAKVADQLALKASTVASQGGEVVARVVDTMKDINDSSRRIADIIGVIDGIAFQTNILALNAAVEAARAGEQGRGFAVVATEVRNLAQRSAAAAKEIKSLIGESVDKVAVGSGLVDQAGQTMSEVVAAIRRVTDIVGEISSASAEQSSGVAQIGQAISQMDQVTQQNASLVEQSAAAAQSLEQQARLLTQMVQTFKLDKHPVQGGGALSLRPLSLAASAV